MAISSSSSSSSIQTLVFCIFFLFSMCYAQRSFRPSALVLRVSKDASTQQYVTKINQRTPSVALDLVLDLGGQFLWVDCENNYISSTYRPGKCKTAQCALATRATACGDCLGGPKPGCNNNSCGLFPGNTITQSWTSGGELAEDVVSLQSTDGSNPGRSVTIPRFLFTCAPNYLLEGLANGAKGMVGLGRARIGLPSQFASVFSFPRKFAICLSSSANGVVFFGDGPYRFLPDIDASQLLTYTPLFINPHSTAGLSITGDPSDEYFIGIKSIKIGDKLVPLNTSLLSIDSKGNGGTKISTVNPYTVLESSIFKAIADTFTREAAAWNISRVRGVAPFDVCFSGKNILFTRVGVSVPYINLVLQNQNVVWTITGSNSMVKVKDNVYCLGFVDGGVDPRTSIVIGGYQLEDKFLQFDLARSRLGFSPTLLGMRTTCANFNFTSAV